ncbi:hypothetical protein ACI2IX_01155 [Leifsonia aquatica]|uniref:hypothetical protein n=1 Tax=Leifsonia aquatica TaxID=144185 RepID=UPI0038500BA3
MAGATVLLGTVAIAAAGCAPVTEEPARIVAAYQQHVVDGDIEAALELDGSNHTESEVLLTNAAYAKATDRISSFEIVGVEVSGDQATVRVQTVQKSGKRLTQMTLSRKDGRWRLRPASLGFLDVQPGPDGVALAISGQPVPTARQQNLAAFPGTYELAGASTQDVEVKSASAKLTGFGVHATLAPSVSPTPEAQQRVQQAAMQYLDGCIAQGDRAQWPSCPFRIDTSDRWWTTGTWNILQLPVIHAEWSPGCQHGAAFSVGPPGCWSVRSDPFPTSYTASADDYEDSTTDPSMSTIWGWTDSLSAVEFSVSPPTR